jgi:hypothetical protein
MQTTTGDFRSRQVAFWKKHQTMLQRALILQLNAGLRFW